MLCFRRKIRDEPRADAVQTALMIRPNSRDPTLQSAVGHRLSPEAGRSPIPVFGWSAVLMALPFVAAGSWILTLAFGWVRGFRMHAAPWVAGCAGAAFFLAGAALAVSGLRGLWRRRRARRVQAEHPDQPWRSDHPWDPRGERAGLGRRVALASWFLGFLLLFTAISVGVAREPSAPREFWIAAWFCGALALLAAGLLGLALVRAWKYRRSFLRFERFPSLLGETFRASFEPGVPLRDFDTLQITLRAVREQVEHERHSRRTALVPYETFHLQQRWSMRELQDLGDSLTVEFELPEDGLTSTLAERPGQFWQLEVFGQCSGADYRAWFLLPIYAPPSGARA